jgi:predicted nucleic acid-binding protein
MKFLVLDASVVVKWYVNEDQSDRAQQLLDSEYLFLAPDLFYAEVGSALTRQYRVHSQISADDLRLALSDLIAMGIEAVSTGVLLERASEISIALGHPMQDCFYLALAERWDTILITADAQFVAKVKNSPWADRITSLAQIDEIV